VIKFVSDLRQVGSFLQILRFQNVCYKDMYLVTLGYRAATNQNVCYKDMYLVTLGYRAATNQNVCYKDMYLVTLVII
jgi:hypothetical protein